MNLRSNMDDLVYYHNQTWSDLLDMQFWMFEDVIERANKRVENEKKQQNSSNEQQMPNMPNMPSLPTANNFKMPNFKMPK